jgi:glycosyltransferase involved in cell wall biosynthesis
VVSIIVATYNRADTLARALESVLRQSYTDWEIIVVDDGSTDDTAGVLAGFSDDRISVIRLAENGGVKAAKNSGFDAIRGDWFTVLDSDDEMTPDALEVMLDYAGRFDANAITCNCLDTSTNAFSGIGPVEDGWLSAADAAKCRGEHWGITSTSLLGDMRFDARRFSIDDSLWFRINAVARRYYIHRALRIYHTEGADRITVSRRSGGFVRKLQQFYIIGQDAEYLRELRSLNPSGYRRTIVRVWVARAVGPLLPGFKEGVRR